VVRGEGTGREKRIPIQVKKNPLVIPTSRAEVKTKKYHGQIDAARPKEKDSEETLQITVVN